MWRFGDIRRTSQPSLRWAEVSEGFLEEEAFEQFWLIKELAPKAKGRGQGPRLRDLTLGIQVSPSRATVPKL